MSLSLYIVPRKILHYFNGRICPVSLARKRWLDTIEKEKNYLDWEWGACQKVNLYSVGSVFY